MASDEPNRKLFAGAGLAALRQGAKEIGTALKAFPDSISVDEPGTALNPTQGEIAETNRNGTVWGRVQEARDRADAAQTKEPPGPSLDRD